jgi:hypothetical protein
MEREASKAGEEAEERKKAQANGWALETLSKFMAHAIYSLCTISMAICMRSLWSVSWVGKEITVKARQLEKHLFRRRICRSHEQF